MIAVTGGAGFIGSCILARLNSLGHKDIWVVDHIDDDLKRRNLTGKKYLEYLDKKDFLKLVTSHKLPECLDCLIHMGACSSTTLNDAKYFEENNFEYSRHLAQWAREHKARFIYASSAATYGDGTWGYKDDDAATQKLKPLNFYGESKHKFDLWVLKNKLAAQCVGLKFFNVFGPNEYHKNEMRSVIAKSYGRVVSEGKISLFKSYKKEYAHGEQKRDFIYVKDAVDVMMHFFDNPAVSGLYNVGTGMARSWNDVAHALFKAVGKKPEITYVEMPENLKSKYQYFTQAEMGKLRQSGFKKKFMSLEDSVAEYAQYLKSNSYL